MRTTPSETVKIRQKIAYAAMAQLVERVLGKDEVGGSNPPSSSKRTSKDVLFLFLLINPKTDIYAKNA